MVIGPGRVNLSLPLGVRAGERGFGARARGPCSCSGTDDGRHHRLVAVLADAHLDALREVDAVDAFEEAMDEMLARLLAVGDDVDAGVLLLLQDEQRGVALGLDQRLALLRPGRPQRLGLGQPERFGQAPGDRGLEHSNASFSAANFLRRS